MANSPIVGENLQLNLDIYFDGTDFTTDINEIENPIAGEWLLFDVENPSNISYLNAFIAYKSDNFTIRWVEGMLPSIRTFAAPHLKMQKQRVIEEVIQYIVDNRDLPTTDPNSTKIIFDNLKMLGNEDLTSKIDDVKAYVIIGKCWIQISIKSWNTPFAKVLPIGSNV